MFWKFGPSLSPKAWGPGALRERLLAEDYQAQDPEKSMFPLESKEKS